MQVDSTGKASPVLFFCQRYHKNHFFQELFGFPVSHLQSYTANLKKLRKYDINRSGLKIPALRASAEHVRLTENGE